MNTMVELSINDRLKKVEDRIILEFDSQCISKGKGKGKGLQEIEAPGFLDSRHLKVGSLSAFSTGLLNPLPSPGDTTGTRFCLGPR